MKKPWIQKVTVLLVIGMIGIANCSGVLAATAKPTATAKAVETAKPSTAPSATPDASGTPSATDAAGGTATEVPQATIGVVSANDPKAATVSNKKYMTSTGAVIWLIVTVLINAIISFGIANRFYRLSKKDNHISSELRALRKDIEEKMQMNVGGFSELDTEVQNNNEDYSRPSSKIQSSYRAEPVSMEENEIYRRWESQLAATQERAERTQARNPRSTTESQERTNRSRAYQSQSSRNLYQRGERYHEIEDVEEEQERPDAKRKDGDNGFSSVRKKAKEIISDIFPFGDDE